MAVEGNWQSDRLLVAPDSIEPRTCQIDSKPSNVGTIRVKLSIDFECFN